MNLSSQKPTSKITNPGHIDIVEGGASDLNERFVRLRIQQPNGTEKTTIERIDHLKRPGAQAEMFERLNQLGAHLISQQACGEFMKALQSKGPQEPSFLVATKVGWAKGAFVRPDFVAGTPDQPLEVFLGDLKREVTSKFRVGGTLKGWKEIPKLAQGNSRLMVSLALAFVGPLGDILDVEQVAIQLCGVPGSGKTAVAIAAGSVWGLHTEPNLARNRGFAETWNNTINKLEPVAAAHNHTLLILDETRAADKARGRSLAETITDTVMRLDKSSEKGRHNDTAAPKVWWVPVLSTSNLSLDEMATYGPATIDEAHRGRLIDIPLPSRGVGIFEDLHGFEDHAALSKRLGEIALEHHGVAAKAYLNKLTTRRKQDSAGLEGLLERWRRRYLKLANSLHAPERDLARIHGKFATIYAAGRLATRFGLLPPGFPKELLNALLSCEQAHIDHVPQQVPPQSQPSSFALLQQFIRDDQGKFFDLRQGPAAPDHDPAKCLGYINEHQGKTEYLITDERLATVVGGKNEARRLKRELFKMGLLTAVQAGDQGTRFAAKRRLIAGNPRQSVIAVDAVILSA